MNTLKKYNLIDYIYILLGSFSLAFGVVAFLSPNKIATGGTAGLAIVLHYIFDLPTGILMALINIPLLFLGIKFIGKKFAIKSIVAIASIVLFIDFLAEFIHLTSMSNNLLLATLYGGVAVGIGLGLIFKGGGSAGGGTIVAKIITSKFDIKTSDVILAIDAIVVCSAGFVFKSIELALWSLISIFAAAKLIDVVLTGKSNQKIVHISSFKNLNQLSANINEGIGVSGTIVNGIDFKQEEKKDILFIVVDKNRINILKNLVYHFDNQAKMIVMDANILLGEE